jgi:hypothetical protein
VLPVLEKRGYKDAESFTSTFPTIPAHLGAYNQNITFLQGTCTGFTHLRGAKATGSRKQNSG